MNKPKASKRKIQYFIDYFKKLNVELTPKTHEEMLAYKDKWVHTYTSDPEIIKHSLPAYNEWTFLWTVFSFEENKALEGKHASEQYDLCKKEKAFIYIDDIDTLFYSNNVETLTSEAIEKACEELKCKYMDIVITAEDFSWTYCRTHEVDWMGPYFYKKTISDYEHINKRHKNY